MKNINKLLEFIKSNNIFEFEIVFAAICVHILFCLLYKLSLCPANWLHSNV
jgi:hypothetical protein